MCTIYEGDGKSKFYIGNQELVLNDAEQMELATLLKTGNGTPLIGLEKANKELETEVSEKQDEIEELTATVRELEYEERSREGEMSSVKLMEKLLRIAPTLTIEEVMAPKEDNAYIHMITESLVGDDEFGLETIINFIVNRKATLPSCPPIQN